MPWKWCTGVGKTATQFARYAARINIKTYTLIFGAIGFRHTAPTAALGWTIFQNKKITPPTIKIGGITISKTLLAAARSLIPKTYAGLVSPSSLPPWHNRDAVQIP